MSIESKLQSYLEASETKLPEVFYTTIVKFDGFNVVDTAKKNIDAKEYAAMSAGLFRLSLRTMKEIEGGSLVHTYIKAEKMEILLMAIPEKKLFVGVTTKEDPNIGLIIYELEKLVNTFKEVSNPSRRRISTAHFSSSC